MPTVARRRARNPVDDSLRWLWVPLRSLLDLRQHREAADALALVGIEERVVIPERDAAVGLTTGPEHVGVREQPVAAVDFFLAADRRQPQRRHAVKQRLAQLQFV